MGCAASSQQTAQNGQQKEDLLFTPVAPAPQPATTPSSPKKRFVVVLTRGEDRDNTSHSAPSATSTPPVGSINATRPTSASLGVSTNSEVDEHVEEANIPKMMEPTTTAKSSWKQNDDGVKGRRNSSPTRIFVTEVSENGDNNGQLNSVLSANELLKPSSSKHLLPHEDFVRPICRIPSLSEIKSVASEGTANSSDHGTESNPQLCSPPLSFNLQRLTSSSSAERSVECSQDLPPSRAFSLPSVPSPLVASPRGQTCQAVDCPANSSHSIAVDDVTKDQQL